MRVFWDLVADAHMRTMIVVEINEAVNLLLGILNVFKAMLLTIDMLSLDSAVYTLGNGIIGRLIVLRHANLDTIFLQFFNIQVAAVLYATVRVMDES